jgi:hypothetical protein
VTVNGRGLFSGLKITVSQTKNLVNQAISVNWSGGGPTDSFEGGYSGRFDENFLQIMECWGSDDHEVSSNPGPPPQQCEFGGQPEAAPSVAPQAESGGRPWEANSRRVDSALAAGQGLPPGVYRGIDGAWMSFRAVDGTTIPVSGNLDAQPQTATSPGNGEQFWFNPYFNFNTTNEDAFGLTRSNGTGSEDFTVDTGLEAPGLGCGQQSEAASGGGLVTPRCWLVIVPRGAANNENAAGDANGFVDTSPLAPGPWQNRIAIPLQFDPIGSVCPIATNATRVIGSELAGPAVANWQPTLCARRGVPPLTYESISDDQARQQLNGQAVGMAVVSRPLDSSTTSPGGRITYAPLTLSGVVVAFNIDRRSTGGPEPAAEEDLLGTRIHQLNLTPRVVAKLLTESYKGQFDGITAFNNVYGANYPPTGYDWLRGNPYGLLTDKDFLQYNPEFQLLAGNAGYDSGLVVEEPNSDAAQELWSWVLADPEARAWLSGTPDPWGMNVNPYYSTNADLNYTGLAFGNPPPESYPKSDPYCFQDPNLAVSPGVLARPLCMQDTFPYASTMAGAAVEGRAANNNAKTTFIYGAPNPDSAFGANGPQTAESHFVLVVTDSASAAQYGLPTAALSAADDDRSSRQFVGTGATGLVAGAAGEVGSSRQFVAPDATGLLAGAKAMKPSDVAGVQQPDVSAAGAYPLTALTYAAVSPPALSTSARGQYASFLDYAAGAGQTPGTAFGHLPPGYVPLPASLRAQTLAAATSIADYRSPAGPGTTTTSEPHGASGGGSGGSGGSGLSGSSAAAGASPASTAGSGAAASAAGRGPSSASPGRGSLSVGSLSSSSGPRSTTPGIWAGAIRYVLPLVLLCGILAGFGARWLEVWRRRTPRKPAAGGGPPPQTTTTKGS